jgi:hypothetical protein
MKTDHSLSKQGQPTLSRRAYVIALACFACHVALLVTFDAGNPDAFLRGDRSPKRWLQVERILAVQSSDQFAAELFAFGLPGEYLWHALSIKVGSLFGIGVPFAILVQLVLATASILLVSSMTVMLTNIPRAGILAGLAYALLPHTFAFPHLLVSEAFFVPLSVFSMVATISYFQKGRAYHGCVFRPWCGR